MTKRILVTGGCGFIGSHIIDFFLKNSDNEIVVLDKLSYAASGVDRLKEIGAIDNPRVALFTADFTEPISEGVKKEIGHIDYILHLGAETHVDRSITDPALFVKVNTTGTLHMLEYARSLPDLSLFLFFSTDEIMGSAPEGVYYKENDTARPENPYAAAKAAGEMIAMAYACTFRLPLMITRTMNVFSKMQLHEKFIPLVIKRSITGEQIIIHATPDLKQAGSRFYISAENVARALDFIILNGKLHTKEGREDGIYNIVGEREIDNLSLTKTIHSIVKKYKSEAPDLNYAMTDHHSSRPGHDLRYALDGSKLRDMGFEYPKNLDQSLEDTVKWYLDNPKWLGL
jgi:dTDP-glucose 4,6-dehydratase